jgi:hypothetical protein
MNTILGDGFTVTVKLRLATAQLIAPMLYVGVTVMVTVTGEPVGLYAVNDSTVT